MLKCETLLPKLNGESDVLECETLLPKLDSESDMLEER